MDWAKAKNVLIIIFLALNIFLAVNNIVVRMESGISSKTQKNIEQILKDKGITWIGKIPSDSSYGAVVSYDTGAGLNYAAVSEKLLGEAHGNGAELKVGEVMAKGSKKLQFKNESGFVYEDSNPNEQVDISSVKNVEKYISGLMNSIQLPVDSKNYISKTAKGTDGSVFVTFTKKYYGFLVFDNYIKAEVTQNGIRYLECSHKKLKDNSFSKKNVKVMTAHQVLLKNLNQLGVNVINEINLGFSSSIVDQGIKGSWEEAVWRVRYDNGRAEYFHAYTGNKLDNIK